MFEAILERILKRVLGEYLQGFDASNLDIGLWSGEVVIQNVRLRKDALKRLGLPMILKFSYIRSLRLKIPWKSLTSSKIEITFSGLYIVLGKQAPSDWEIRDTKIIDQRKKEIDSFAEQVLKKYEEKRSAQKSESTYTDKLVLKIIDNLQVQISDIHIRYEDTDDGYAFGLTLENFKLTTVNKQGLDEYIDRSKPEYKNQPLRKRLQLRNFGIYWNRRDSSCVSQTQQPTINSLDSLIQKTPSTTRSPLQYLILINSQARLLQRNKGNFDAAEITLQISIKQLSIELENKQLQQMITLSETFQRYGRLVRESNRANLDKETREKYREEFVGLYKKYLNANGQLQGEELKRYENILEKMETTNFAEIVREEIRERERKRIISEKELKKFAWISYGRKQLSEAELKQIENFLQDNFSQEQTIITRPIDYSYIEVRLSLAEAVFTVGKKQNSVSQGVELTITQLETIFRKRETGYSLDFLLSDLKVDIYRRAESNSISKRFFYKLTESQSKYIEIFVNSNPVGRPHIDTELKINVKQSVIIFTPVFITRLKRFIDLNVAESNKDLALQKIGEIKGAAGQTLVSSLQTQRAKVIDLNIVVNAPIIVLPFTPGLEQQACWSIDMGMLRITTDEKMIDPNAKPTMEKYNLSLTKLSLSWFKTQKKLLESKIIKAGLVPEETLINDFEIQLSISLLKNNKEKGVGNIQLQGRLPSLQMTLSGFSYQQVLQLGDCFKDTVSPMLESADVQPIESPPQKSKKQIMSGSEKLGILYKRNTTTKLWEKFICICKGSYLYLFPDKTAEQYTEQIYLRNSKITELQQQSAGRPNSFSLSNKVNKDVTLSCDKADQMQQWIKLISGKKDEQSIDDALKEVKEGSEQTKVDFEQLKVVVGFEVPQVKLCVFEREKQWLTVEIGGLKVNLNLFEAKTNIQLLLNELQLVDLLEVYKEEKLNFLLKSVRGSEAAELVAITISQVDDKDPTYAGIDNDIEIKFGVLHANFKPRTISKVFQFFLPSNPPKVQPPSPISHKSSLPHNKIHFSNQLSSFISTPLTEDQRIGVKLTVRVTAIQLNLVNKHTKLKHGWLQLRTFEVTLTQSPGQMMLSGSLQRLQVVDSTGYPNTAISEEDNGGDLVLFDTRQGQETELLVFNVKLKENVMPGEKRIVVKVLVKDINIEYFQQPVLRLISYLLVQLLPALEKEQDATLKLRKPEVQRPKQTDIVLDVAVMSSQVCVRSSPKAQTKLVLNIGCIEVRNRSSNEKYAGGDNITIVDHYQVKISGLAISIDTRALTNEFNFILDVQLISSPQYYRIQYGSSFSPGIRINCRLSPFLLRLNNSDYKLIMRCLNCNIAFDDNCDVILFPQKFLQIKQTEHLKEKVQDDPIYFSLKIDMVTLAVSEEMIPVSLLTLRELEVGFTGEAQGMRVEVGIMDVVGSSFQADGEMYVERGIIKELDINRRHRKEDLIELKDLVRLFYKEPKLGDSPDLVKDVGVLFEQSKQGNSLTEITIEGLFVSLQLRPLLKLSKLVALDDSVKAPQPRLPVPPDRQKPTTSQNRLRLIANAISFRAATDNSSKQIGISGQFFINFLSKPKLTLGQVQQQVKLLEMDRCLENGGLSVTVNHLDICFYETVGRRVKKRVLLNPTNLIIIGKSLYALKEGRLMMTSEFVVKVEFILLEATIKDLNKLKGLYETAMGILREEGGGGVKNEEEQVEVDQGPRVTEIMPPTEEQVKRQMQKLLSSEQALNDTRAQVNIGQICLVILFESKSLYVPVLRLQILQTNPILKSNLLLTQLSIITFTQLSFFNPRSSHWQPIIQKNSTVVEYVSTRKYPKNQTTLAIENGHDPEFDRLLINVSSQFLTSLGEVISEIKRQEIIRQGEAGQEQEEEELEVSPYIVENMTFEEAWLMVGVSEESVSRKSMMVRRKVVVSEAKDEVKEVTKPLPPLTRKSIDIPTTVKNIKIRIAGQVHSVSIMGFTKRRIGQTKYVVDCKIQKLNRLIRITSDTISNLTTRDITLKYGGRTLNLSPQQTLPFTESDTFQLGHNQQLLTPLLKKQDLFQLTPLNCKDKYHYNLRKFQQEVDGMMLQEYTLYSPLRLINCLPKPLQLQVIFRNKTTANKELKSQNEYEIHSHTRGEEIKLKVSLPGCFWSHEVSIADNIEREIGLTVKDAEGIPLTISAMITKHEVSQAIEIAFYCAAYVVNQTSYDIIVYGSIQDKQKSYKKISGQKDLQGDNPNDRTLILIGSQTGTSLKLSSLTYDKKSQSIFIGGIDSSQVQLHLEKGQKDIVVMLGVEVSVKQMHKNSAVICKQIRIVPRHVIFNNTGEVLMVVQEGEFEKNQVVAMGANERRVIQYHKSKRLKGVFKLERSLESMPIALDTLGVVNFYVRQPKPSINKIYMRADIQMVQRYIMIILSLIPPQSLPYQIRNCTKGFIIQSDIMPDVLTPLQSSNFCWQNPESSHQILLRITHTATKTSEKLEINTDKVGKSKQVEFEMSEKGKVGVRVEVKLLSDKRVLEVRERRKEGAGGNERNEVVGTVGVKIANISLSLVLNHGSIIRPYEAFLVTLLDLEFLNQETVLEQTYQLRLRFLQLDQNYPHLLQMPVVITPSKFKQFMSKDSPKMIINLLIRRNLQTTKSFLISEIALQVNPITIRVSQLFIKLILQLLKQFSLAYNVKQQEFLVKRLKDDWKTLPVQLASKPIYIQQIRISPIHLDVTAQLKPPDSTQNRNFVVIQMILKGFGLVVGNIDQAPLRLSGIQLSGCFDSIPGMTNKLIAHYKKNMIMEVYKLVGSFNVIGNPLSLFSNIATGLQDLVEKPAEGFVKGPLELGKGIVGGAHSLVAHTVGGAINSVSKIVGTVSSGLALLAFDKGFEEMRERQRMRKPKNVVEGLQKGAEAVFVGFKEGMTGVFLKPYENAKKDGFLGFLKGTGQGLAGVIIKPVTGILDFASKTTQGLKNTALYFEDKPNQNRMQCPRVFYGRNSQLRQYVTLDAQINNVLMAIKKGRFSECHFQQAFMIKDEAFAVLDEYVVMLSFRKKKMDWYLPVRIIKAVMVEEGEHEQEQEQEQEQGPKIKLCLSQESKYFDTLNATFRTVNEAQVMLIKERIEEQMKYKKK